MNASPAEMEFPFGNPATHVVLDHGTGARLSRDLVERIVGILGDVYIGQMEDSAVLRTPGRTISMTTDCFVVDPCEFGNGDIGKIAVCGTVNDLAVSGATPAYLTLSMIIETGFPLDRLDRIVTSIRDATVAAGVQIVAGDTKVVRKGEADGIFINTTGVGILERPAMHMTDVRPGDAVIVSGWLGNHSVHLLSIREGLGFEKRVLSDCAVLNHMIAALLDETPEGVRAIRDVTRGGLSGVLHEFAQAAGHDIRFSEDVLPIQVETRMAADMLGISPLHLANEGCLAIFLDPAVADSAIEILRRFPEGEAASIIGHVQHGTQGQIEMVTSAGGVEVQQELIGAVIPRLC